MRYIVERDFERVPYYSRYVPACWYRVYASVSEFERDIRATYTTRRPLTTPMGYAEVVDLAKLGLKNTPVLERRIAELAFPEVKNLSDYSYPNRLPQTYWRGVPEDCWKNAKRDVILDEIPPEWFEQDRKECTNTLVQDKVRRRIIAEKKYARGS